MNFIRQRASRPIYLIAVAVAMVVWLIALAEGTGWVLGLT
jgi:hypothetical protein